MPRTLAIQGMHCQNCVRKLTDALASIPGVTSAHVTLEPPQARIEATDDVSLAALQGAVDRVGSYRLTDAIVPRTPPDTAHVAGAASQAASAAVTQPRESLYPLCLIVAFIAGTVMIGVLSRGPITAVSWHGAMLDFMAGFFLVFSFFKLLNLRGFADAYQTYDVLAARSRPWALAYPFIELALGIAYLTRWNLTITNAATLALMLLGSVGVLRALLAKRRIRCACLGTALNLPMTTITLVEDLAMAAMAAAALIWGAM